MRALILSHFLIDPTVNAATSSSLHDYLRGLGKFSKIVQIEQPFLESKSRHFYIIKSEGSVVSKKFYFAVKKPSLLAYIIHPFLNFVFVLKEGFAWDLVVACENLSFLSIFLLKKVGLVKKTVYYSVDYVAERFENKVINAVYHFFDRLAVYNSDVNWVVAKEQIAAREKNGVNLKKAAPFVVVPIGFRASEIKVKEVGQVELYNLVFCGTLRESAGIGLVISALPLILKKFPRVRITFVGNGDKLPWKKLASSLGVANKIKFYQGVDSHLKLVRIITKCSVGLAPYVPVPGSISLTSDPGKIKLYLLCGLPVVTTKVATSHKLIADNEAGVVVAPNPSSLAKGVIDILSSKKKYARFKSNAVRIGKMFDADRIFGKALEGYL